MTDRPPARELADTLRQIQAGKKLERDRHRKDRPQDWIDRYDREINALAWAAIGYDKLAEREAGHG